MCPSHYDLIDVPLPYDLIIDMLLPMSSSFADITIGFVQTNFTVRQSAGNVTLAVMLLGGTLGQNISINVDTVGDGELHSL